MTSLLYTIVVLLLIFWILGFFVFSLGALIHVALVVAVIALILALIRRI